MNNVDADTYSKRKGYANGKNVSEHYWNSSEKYALIFQINSWIEFRRKLNHKRHYRQLVTRDGLKILKDQIVRLFWICVTVCQFSSELQKDLIVWLSGRWIIQVKYRFENDRIIHFEKPLCCTGK